jgi:MFS family permease
LLGGVVVGAGWILGSFSHNIPILAVTYGIIGGSGVGLAYGGPIAVSTRWFPDKKGLAVGLTLVGFGLSPLITAPLARMLINMHGPLQTLGTLGSVFLILIILLSLPLRFPPAGWKPTGWKPKETLSTTIDANTSNMLRKPVFYGLWSCYVIGTLSGLMAIGISSQCGQEIIKIDPAMAATAVSIFAVFNGLGRPLFGWLTDRITPRYSAIISFLIILGASIGMLNAREGNLTLYMLSFFGFWLTLGGWLAIAPTSTATFFGTKHYTKNYGIVFTAYGAGAILGTMTSGMLKDVFGSYIYAFYPTAGLAVVGIIIASLLLRRSK